MEKPKRRDRYIAFEVPEPRLGGAVAAALHEAVASWPPAERPHVLFLEGRRGLVRCGHRQKEEVVRLLNGIRVGSPSAAVRTVGASGTIRRARMRYFVKP